eukprot:Rmarinus@m.23604
MTRTCACALAYEGAPTLRHMYPVMVHATMTVRPLTLPHSMCKLCAWALVSTYRASSLTRTLLDPDHPFHAILLHIRPSRASPTLCSNNPVVLVPPVFPLVSLW